METVNIKELKAKLSEYMSKKQMFEVTKNGNRIGLFVPDYQPKKTNSKNHGLSGKVKKLEKIVTRLQLVIKQ